MDDRLKNINDKWKESRYHFYNMKKYANCISENNSENRQECINNFRYEFNSFVNSTRSITFVIQKTFKNKFDDFEEWYSKKQEELSKNSFAKTINNLRTLNQKEGNYYPLISKIYKINDDFLFIEDYSAIPTGIHSNQKISKHVVNRKFIPNPESPDEEFEYDNKPNETFEQVKENMHKLLMSEYLNRLSKIKDEDFKNAKFLYYNITLDDNHNISFDEFFTKCNDILEYLKKIAIESENKFLK